MNRGEVWSLVLDGQRHELPDPIARGRPVVILSNNAANRNLDRVVVVPLTADGDRQYPGEARVTIADKPCKVSADQITTMPRASLATRVGELSRADLRAVEEAVQTHLALPR